PRIVAPDRDPAARATRDELAGVACRRRVDQLGRTAQQPDALRLDQGVERERRAALALAPGAMAAVHEERPAGKAKAHGAARASALEGWVGAGDRHGGRLCGRRRAFDRRTVTPK